MTENTGRSGYLRLAFESRSRTVLAEQFARAPFHVLRAVHCDAMLPEMAYVYMMSTSGGTLGGDAHKISILAGENAAAHVTTQGANRIYGTRSAGASQATEITLEGGSYLEFMPDQTIPYGGSRYVQTAAITADPTATLVYSDVLASGRSAMGESFQYDSYDTRAVARDPDGRTLFRDAARLEPKRRGVAEYGVMGEYAVTGTVYVLAPPSRAAKLQRAIASRVSGRAAVPGGASLMRGGAGVMVRLLGGDARSVLDAARGVAGVVRRETWGTPLPADRRC